MPDPREAAPLDPLDISVVIPNLDGERWLPGCLASLRDSTPPPREVIVSDDGSGDASVSIAEGHGARVVRGERPRSGFAATANRGMAEACGEWILLLNNDTEVAPEACGLMVAAALRRGAAIVAPLVASLRDPAYLDSAGLLLFADATARPRLHAQPVERAPSGHEWILVPSGAAVLFRRDLLGTVGALDESLGSYLEDVDWALRCGRAGHRVLLAPEAVVRHWFSGTTGALSPHKARMIERNHVVVAARHLPAATLLLLPVWTAARWAALAVAILGSRATDDAAGPGGAAPAHPPRALALAAARGALEGALALPGALADRRRLAREFPVDAGWWRARLRTQRARVRDYLQFGL